jgi:hypothetical protein
VAAQPVKSPGAFDVWVREALAAAPNPETFDEKPFVHSAGDVRQQSSRGLGGAKDLSPSRRTTSFHKTDIVT